MINRISHGLWDASKKSRLSEIEQIVFLTLVYYWRKHSSPAYFPKWLTLLPFLLSTSDKEVYSVSLFIYIPLPKISPNKAYLMIYSLLKGKLIYNNHLIINVLKGGFESGIHSNREIWLFQRGHICYPFCTAEEKKPAEPRWSWMWHSCFEVLFVFTGWPMSCWKESPSPTWSHSKTWGGERIERVHMLGPTRGILQHRCCTRGISSSGNSRESRSAKMISEGHLSSDQHIRLSRSWAHHTLPVLAAISSILRQQQHLIAQMPDSGCSHLPDEMFKMDIKVSQICFMPPLLTPHNYRVLADAQPKSQGTEDKLAGSR